MFFPLLLSSPNPFTLSFPSPSLLPPSSSASPQYRTADNETLLHLSIRHQLDVVVDRLCAMGADLSANDKKGNSPLWMALRSRQESCASKLVREEQ